jgi:Flp pilus assembly protein TadD
MRSLALRAGAPHPNTGGSDASHVESAGAPSVVEGAGWYSNCMVGRMDNALQRLELVPMDDVPGEETPAPAPPSPPPQPSLPTISPAQHAAIATEASLDASAIEIPPFERTFPSAASSQAGDAFIAQALREYAQGHFDTPLWDRALKHNDGNPEAAAAMYIPARAVALRMLDRKRRETVKRAASQQRDDGPMIPKPSLWQRYKAAIVVAAVIVPAGIAGAVYMASRGEDAVLAMPVVKRAVAAPAAAPEPAKPTTAELAAAKVAKDNAVLAAKVQQLRDAGNYNVMVIYATEWTRKQPDNVDAWDELRVGYLHLRQYEDARNAAKKAVQLAPDDPRLWRSLAAVNMDIDDPEAALAAYEHAAARNSADVESLNAIALLQARLGRPQEAKAAFDRAVAANPGDAVTACLRNGVAQMPAARDAYTLSRQVRAIDNRCHGKPDAVAAAR